MTYIPQGSPHRANPQDAEGLTAVPYQADNLREFSDALIKQGVTPTARKYEKVRPRGLYMLMPSMWRWAKQIEQANDMSYDILMNQAATAFSKQRVQMYRELEHSHAD